MKESEPKKFEEFVLDDFALDDMVIDNVKSDKPVILSAIEFSSVKIDLKKDQWRAEIRLKAFDENGAIAGNAPVTVFYDNNCISSGKTDKLGRATIRTTCMDLLHPKEKEILLEVRGTGVQVLFESRMTHVVTQIKRDDNGAYISEDSSECPQIEEIIEDLNIEEVLEDVLEDVEEDQKEVIDQAKNFMSVEDKFMMSQYQVTQKEYFDVIGLRPSEVEGDDLPVTNVSWLDAIEYCNQRSKQEGLETVYEMALGHIIIPNISKNGYRLPAEEEWEYAAKGGKKSKGYKYIGSDNPYEIAWFDDNSNGKPHPVGKKKPNELELYDMCGNVWEWCWDSYDAHSGGAELPVPSRVLCGGAWAYGTKYLKPSGRRNNSRGYKHGAIGFRCVKLC